MPCLPLPAPLKHVGSAIAAKMPAPLKNAWILVGFCGVGALFAFLCLVGYASPWEGEQCINGACRTVDPQDDAPISEYAFGSDDANSAEGSGGAAFAFVLQLVVLGLSIAALVLSLPVTKFKSLSCATYLLAACLLCVLISFCYFAEHTDEQTVFNTKIEVIYKPSMTWGFVFGTVLAIFVYIPAIVLALAAEGASDVPDTTATPTVATPAGGAV